MTYDVGDVYPATATFKNAAGVPTNPTTIVLEVTIESTGTVTTPAVTNVSAGVYSCDVALTIGGNWTLRWTGTGAVTAAEVERIHVRPNPVPLGGGG